LFLYSLYIYTNECATIHIKLNKKKQHYYPAYTEFNIFDLANLFNG